MNFESDVIERINNKAAILTNVNIYKGYDNVYYMCLDYKYQDDDGEHIVKFPKVDFPFSTHCIPFVSRYCGKKHFDYTIQPKYPIYLHPCDSAIDPITHARLKGVCVMDRLVTPAVKKMTIDEIEKALGYKIEIVDKKENKS